MSPLFFTDHGNGNPVILLHGFCESHEIWHVFDNDLSKHFRVICPDLPGFGGSRALDSEFSLADVADTLKTFLDELQIRKCVLIGHSLGGYITLAFAERHPELLKGFGLFHSSAFGDSSEKKEIRTRLMEFVQQNEVGPFVKTFVPSLFFEENLWKYERDVEFVKGMALKTPANTVIEYARAMRDRPERLHVLKNADQPVLFIIGKEDTSIPYDLSLEQSRMPIDPVVHILKKTGHMGMFERTSDTLSAVRNFVQYSYQ